MDNDRPSEAAAGTQRSRVAPSRQDKKPMTVFLPAPLHHRLKLLAVLKEHTMQALVEEAILDLLSKHDEPDAPSTKKAD